MFFITILPAFLALVKPVSSIAKPACIKKTKVPQINSQTVFNDVILFSSYLDSLVYGLPFALGSEPGFIKNESTMRVAR